MTETTTREGDDATPAENDRRVLVLMPTAKDAERTAAFLSQAGIACHVCRDTVDLCDEAKRGVGAVLLTEELLLRDADCLAVALREQPAWSAVPLVVLTEARDKAGRDAKLSEFAPDVTLVERPVRVRTLLSVVAAAIHARRQQYAIRDAMSEREQQAEALRDSEAKFRQLANTIPNLAWMARPDGYIFWYNGRWYEYTGTTPQQIEGWGWRNVHDPSVLPDVIERWGRSLARGEPFEMVFPIRGADGIFRPFLTRAQPHRGEGGRILYWFGTNTDISSQMAAESRLRLLDAVSEATRQSASPAAVMAVTTALVGEHLRATRCAYADVDDDNDRFNIRHDWTVHGAASTVGEYSLNLFGPRAASDLRGGRTLVVRDVDRELPPEQGGDMFNSIGIKALVSCPLVKDGRLMAMMAVHQDSPRPWTADEVSLIEDVVERCWAHIERARSEEALREADRRKDEFLATLAHELRNPLAPIRTGLQVLKMVPPGGGEAVETLSVMERQLGHMVHLVDDLLDVSRVSRGKVELRRERIPLRSVIDAAVETTRPLLEANGHRFRICLPAEPITLYADPTRTAQIVSNLLNNAAKYTPEGGRVELNARREAGGVAIRVIDNGVGIPTDMLPEVFELFTQVGRSIDRSQGGLGIGLALVKRLVEMHGGTISAESPGAEQGSTFTVWLPLADQENEPSASPPPAASAGDAVAIGPAAAAGSAAAAEQGAGGRRILVVDDNVDGASSLATMLRFFGHTARVAHDGQAALDAARVFRPELVFLDIGMPGMNGYEVARRFRSDPALAAAKLVALTGWGQEDDRRRTTEAGFDRHLVKPAEPAVLREILGELS